MIYLSHIFNESMFPLLSELSIQVFTLLVSAIVPVILGIVTEYVLGKKKQKRLKPKPDYNERIRELSNSLNKASVEVDSILQEITSLIRKRQSSLLNLEQQQAEYQKKIEHLKGIPVPAAEYFTQQLQQVEQTNKMRDYRLFFLGIAVTTVVGVITIIVLHLLKLA